MNSKSESMKPTERFALPASGRLLATLTVGVALAQNLSASENVPYRPFAEWADVPAKGQFVVGLVYEESEAYHIYAGHDQHNVTWHSGGEEYGIDVNQGFVTVQYGITAKWA